MDPNVVKKGLLESLKTVSIFTDKEKNCVHARHRGIMFYVSDISNEGFRFCYEKRYDDSKVEELINTLSGISRMYPIATYIEKDSSLVKFDGHEYNVIEWDKYPKLRLNALRKQKKKNLEFELTHFRTPIESDEDSLQSYCL